MTDWYEKSIELHRLYGGKLEVMPKVPVKGQEHFAIWYTPGVAGPSRRIAEDILESFELTWRWNTIAVVSDGTRVLGLGDIGAEAALPVMEGKALLFKLLGGVDAIPIVHRARKLEQFLWLLKALEPSFGGYNLEDIESPKCFALLEKARRELDIPVWHDDQQGTATVVLAALLAATRLTGLKLEHARIVLFGVGAANIALYNLLKSYGIKPQNIVAIDSRGVLHPEREDIAQLRKTNPWKYRIAVETMPSEKTIEDAFNGAHIVVAASKPGPNVIKKEWVKRMSKPAIVFALANPVPEIWPWEAKEAGAQIVATGRSDLPNQVNNSLVFPSMFRGVLDVRAKTITDGMAIAAAKEIASYVEDTGLSEDRIVPSMTEWEVYPRVAAAVAEAASREGVARKPKSYREELRFATELIEAVREKYKRLEKILEKQLVGKSGVEG